HLLGICNHFHCEVCFTIVGAAADRSCDSRRFIWVEEVGVKRYCEAVGIPADDRYGFVHDCSDPATIDLLHREHADAGFLHELAFLRVDLPYSDLDCVFRQDFRGEAKDMSELNRTISHDCCHRHSVHVSARRNVRSIKIGVCIEPYESDLLSGSAKTLRDSRNSTYRDGMIAPEHERCPSFQTNL